MISLAPLLPCSLIPPLSPKPPFPVVVLQYNNIANGLLDEILDKLEVSPTQFRMLSGGGGCRLWAKVLSLCQARCSAEHLAADGR